MKVYMSGDEVRLFQKYLKKSNKLLEYGSGGSTLYASNYVDQIISVETDSTWIQKIKSYNKTNIKFIHVDINCVWWKYVSWAEPQLKPDEDMKKLWKKYSNISIDDDIDLVLIDGRFRVATLLNLYDKIKPDTNILVHDYTRVGYHILETFYDKIECVDSLQVFKKRENIDRELLKKYSLEYELVID